MLKGGDFQYLVVFAGDDSLYGIDLKIKLEREIVKKIVLGKWSPTVNSLPAMDAHERHLFIELCGTVVSCQIFICSQSLIAC